MLSVAQIKSLKIGDKKRHTDRDGLVLELRPGKKKFNKVFIFRFQWDKKPQTITIGKFPSIELGIALIFPEFCSRSPDLSKISFT